MLLIPDPLRDRLVANFKAGPRHDPVPMVKLYAPWDVAVWLLTELMEDGDALIGLCDLGFGWPELGYVSWAELEALRGPLGLASGATNASRPTGRSPSTPAPPGSGAASSRRRRSSPMPPATCPGFRPIRAAEPPARHCPVARAKPIPQHEGEIP